MVIDNIFYTKGGVVRPAAVYDIKGSWVDRNASGTRDHRPTGGTFKDQDLNEKLYLPIDFRNQLRRTLNADTSFLASYNLMDYSLLLGVCKRPFHNHEYGIERKVPITTRENAVGTGGASGSDQQLFPEGRPVDEPFFRLDGGGLAAAVGG
jgi:hypothetical protein